MPRFTDTRVSRLVLSVTVIAVAIGAAIQFHHLRKPQTVTTSPPPLQMSVNPIEVVPNPVKQSTVLPGPLVTRTPDQRSGNNTDSQLPSNRDAGKHPSMETASNPPQPRVVPVPSPVPAPVPVVVKNDPAPAAGTAAVIADAEAKVTAGDYLAARTVLNTALLAGTLNAVDTDAVKKQLAEVNQTVIFSPKQFPKDPLGGVYTVKPNERLSAIGSAHQVPYEFFLALNRMTDARKLRYGQTLKVINGPFHAIVNKSKFTMDLYLGAPGGPGSTYITTFAVGLGSDNSTPTGTWKIKDKVTHPAYFAPEGHPGPTLLPDDPKNPLGPYWLGLEGTDGQAVGQQSYGIHGTIDPTSIGRQSSMGCIRLKNEDVEVVYKMLMQGKSTVVIKE